MEFGCGPIAGEAPSRGRRRRRRRRRRRVRREQGGGGGGRGGGRKRRDHQLGIISKAVKTPTTPSFIVCVTRR